MILIIFITIFITHHVVEMPPIGELVRLLKGVMSKWKRLALFLEVNTDAIIPGDRQCCDCMTDMITEWMNRKKNKATIGAVVQALQHLGNNKLAREIEQGINIQLLEHIISSFLCSLPRGYYMKVVLKTYSGIIVNYV